MTRKAGKIATLLISALLLLNTACTTMKPVYNVDDMTYAGQLKPGDRVLLSFLDGRSKEIDISEVSETTITGTTHKNTDYEPKGHEVVADWRDIDTVQTVKVSALKTAGAAVGAVVVIPVLALVALIGMPGVY